MGKLDLTYIRYMTAEDVRVLSAIELCHRNHELVNHALAAQYANLRSGGVHKVLKELCKQRLLSYERGKGFDGYRLSNAGYDYLAIHALTMKGTIAHFGSQMGIGKESNIYVVADEDQNQLCLKLHRLGRTCFRNIKNKRDYHKHRRAPSWLYLSRISATKEFAYMEALYEQGFPVPKPIACNRHCIVMELIPGIPMRELREFDNIEGLYDELMDLVVRFANVGVIHGDFNEFNIMITPEGKPIVIDFPQMVSTMHENAEMYFERDVEGTRRFFKQRFNYESELYPKFSDIEPSDVRLDSKLHCSGFSRAMEKLIEKYNREKDKSDDDDNGDQDEDINEEDKNDNSEETVEKTVKESQDLENDDEEDFESGSDSDRSDEEDNEEEIEVKDDDVKEKRKGKSKNAVDRAEINKQRLQRLKRQKERAEIRKKCIAKGEASAKTRRKRDNFHTINDKSGFWW